MKRPGDDGYDFPCGDSHSRITQAYGLHGYSPPGPRFSNSYSGEVYRPTKEQVTKFKLELEEQIKICDMFLSSKDQSNDRP